MTALEMLDKLQASLTHNTEVEVDSVDCLNCRIMIIVKKLREEQQDNHLDTILTMFRSVGGSGEHCYSRQEIENYVASLVDRL